MGYQNRGEHRGAGASDLAARDVEITVEPREAGGNGHRREARRVRRRHAERLRAGEIELAARLHGRALEGLFRGEADEGDREADVAHGVGFGPDHRAAQARPALTRGARRSALVIAAEESLIVVCPLRIASLAVARAGRGSEAVGDAEIQVRASLVRSASTRLGAAGLVLARLAAGDGGGEFAARAAARGRAAVDPTRPQRDQGVRQGVEFLALRPA